MSIVSNIMYQKLTKDFGTTSSWTVWAAPQNGDWSSKCSISDMTPFMNTGSLLPILNNEFIFVGLNPAAHTGVPHSKGEWEAFHSSDQRRSQDYKLRYALRDTPYWGSFITDIYTGIVETNANNAVKRATHGTTKKSVDDIMKIRQILGGTATITAIGEKAYKILKKELPATVVLKKITHYSYRINIDKYRDTVLNQLK